MSIEVVTYESPRSLFNHDTDYLKNTIHVCATSNMAKALSDITKRENITEKSIILSMSEFSKVLFPEWFSEETILVQSIELIDYLNNFEHTDDTLAESYKRNKEDLLNTLRLLYFCDITIKDLTKVVTSDKATQKERFLPVIYEWFARSRSNHSRSLPGVNDKFDMTSKLTKKKKNFSGENLKLVFHGFYFITPEQQRIMEYIKSLGFDINFLLYYKQEFNDRFKFITKFVNSVYGWPDLNDWTHLKDDEDLSLGDKFLSIFDNRSLVDIEGEKIKKYEFNNFTDFLSHVEQNNYLNSHKNNPDAKLIMTTNSKYMNDRMQEFYPEHYKSVRNFLKYPIGYLLINLHELWETEYKDIRATVNQVEKLLATKYFFSSEAEEYLLDVFRDLTFFFIQCETKEEWNNQFNKLFDIRSLIEGDFKHASPSVDRYHHNHDLVFNESPFSYLPYLSISSENLKTMKNKVLAIFKLAETLFDTDSNEVDLNHHLQKLVSIVADSKKNYTVDALDINILDELLEKLNSDINIEGVNKDYISDAIQFYLSGTANDDIDHLIEPLVNIDGEIFRNRELHITGLDENGLPYGEYALPWPLSESLIRDLSKNNKYLQLLVYRNASVKDMTRYLLSMMFEQSGKIELSHIKNYKDNVDLESSFYIDLMGEHVENTAPIQLDFEQDISGDIDQNETYDISNYSIDKKAEYIFYPNRLSYSKASKQTTYNSTFQQRFVLSKLATYLLMNNDQKNVKPFLVDIFPQIDELTIELKIDIAKRYAASSAGSFNLSDHEVSDYRKLFLFPTLKWDEINKLYAEARELTTIDNHSFKDNSLRDDYIYPYVDIEYPENLKGEDNDKY